MLLHKLFNCLLSQILYQSITWLQPKVFRHLDVVKPTCWSWIWASECGRKCVLSAFDRGMVVVPETVDLLGFSHTQWSLGFTESARKEKISCEWQLCVLVDAKVTAEWAVSLIGKIGSRWWATVTLNNHLLHKGGTLKKMGYSSSRPHRGGTAVHSKANRKGRKQFRQAHQN